LIDKIKTNKIDFDILVATPEMMPKLAQVAKILGPKGLMPNPKTDTVTPKIKEAVKALKKGKASFRSDNTGIIHQLVGKISFSEDQLIENAKVFLETVEKFKPVIIKGKLVKKVFLCSTMGIGIEIKS
jgi:large subunit ribosomal protein L1